MKVFPVVVGLCAAGVFATHYLAFAGVPMEATMGAAQRIFYYHVPSAWLCFLGFMICFVASLGYLYTRKTRWDAVALSAAEVGLVFGVIVLTTGPLWARAAWGVWWKWEPRLTSMALLILIFGAYWTLRTFGGQTDGVRRLGAVLAIFGTPNIFFVHYAVKKWRGDHPDGVTSSGGMEPSMRVALYSSLAVLLVVFIIMLRQRYVMHRDALTVRAIRRRLARLGGQ